MDPGAGWTTINGIRRRHPRQRPLRPVPGELSTADAAATPTLRDVTLSFDHNPTAVNDAKTVDEDSGATTIDVLANDTDPDGGPKTIAAKTNGSHGTVTITNGGADLTYTPDANYCGSDTNAIDVLANDTDADGGPKTIVAKTNGAHGTVTITRRRQRTDLQPRRRLLQHRRERTRLRPRRQLHLHAQRRLDGDRRR